MSSSVKIAHVESTRMGFKYLSLSGLTCLIKSQNRKKVLVDPLEAFLRSLITEGSILLLNTPDFYLDNERVFDIDAYEKVVPSYKGTFFLASVAQSLVLEGHRKDLFYQVLPWLNSEDGWSGYCPKSSESREELLSYFASFGATGQGDFNAESRLISAIMKYCDFLICPGGDGEFVDLYFETDEARQSIAQAIDVGLNKLLEMERTLGPMQLDTYHNRNIPTSGSQDI